MNSIRFLRSFLAVAHHGSFSEAAEQVARTQAAISFQMRSLEAELGRELFDRSGRLAILNAAGRELLPDVKQLVDLYDRLKSPRNTPGALAGAVSIGAVVSCMGTLSKVVSSLKREHPGLDVRVLSGNRSEEHTSELQSLMRISYAVFCLKKKHSHTLLSVFGTEV